MSICSIFERESHTIIASVYTMKGRYAALITRVSDFFVDIMFNFHDYPQFPLL